MSDSRVKSGRGLIGAALDVAAIGALAWALAGQTALRAASSSDPPPDELEVKAAFVLNFIRLVGWPSVPEEGNGTELPVCALAKTDFANAVRQAVDGKAVGNRTISFKITPAPEPSRCRALIVDTSQYPMAREVMKAVRDSPVLTVGNGAGLLAIGGMFELVVEDRKVQFDASLEAVRRAKLDVSARLLQLSRNLRKGAGRGF